MAVPARFFLRVRLAACQYAMREVTAAEEGTFDAPVCVTPITSSTESDLRVPETIEIAFRR